MIVLLPPSETKRDGGDGSALDLATLGWPEFEQHRRQLVDAVVTLAADPAACRSALGISAGQDLEIERNASLRTAPTMPALRRYTGVLYDALDVDSLRGAQLARAQARLAVGSALFGLLRAEDRIPAYRLSASSKLPGHPTLAAGWRPLLGPALTDLASRELVVDLRSGAYVGLGRLDTAVQVNVVSERADGRRTVVSHFNKAHKGRLARALVTSRSDPNDAAGVAAVARRAKMNVERDGNRLTVVVAA